MGQPEEAVAVGQGNWIVGLLRGFVMVFGLAGWVNWVTWRLSGLYTGNGSFARGIRIVVRGK